MTDLIVALLGPDYVRPFILLVVPFPIMLVCTLLFAHSMERRRLFLLRFLAGLLVVMACYTGAAIIRTDYSGLFTRILTICFAYFVILPLLFFCYRDTPANILLCWCAGFATQEISVRIFTMLLSMTGADTRNTMSFFGDFNALRDYTIFYLLHFLIAILCYLAFRRNRSADADPSTVRTITLLSVFSALWLAVSNSISREFQAESDILYQVIQFSGLIFSVFVLLLRTDILFRSQYRQEVALMEQLLREERKQYQNVKENIDIVNMKCHDLKHQLSNLSSKLTDREIKTLQEAISIYDNNIKTGSEVLDVLLYEKQLVCRKEGITLTCMADGKALSFMRTAHIYSLFNNALGNALEAVQGIDDSEMRVVDISVVQNAGAVEITVSNYFQGERVIRNGLPTATTKQDKSHHGFGIQSMKYVAAQYGGSVETFIESSVFTLKISIPIPAHTTVQDC